MGAGPVQKLDKNGLMFTKKLKEFEDQAIEDEKEKRKKRKGTDVTGDLLDGMITMLGALRKRM
jgi:hypothetical protein